MKRHKADLVLRSLWSGSTPLFPAYFFSLLSSFCSPALPPDCLSVDIVPDSAHANDLGGRGVHRLDSLPPPPPSSSSSSFPWVEQEWSGEPKHAEKSRAWGLIR